MFILDIATWIANLLILGIALVVWAVGILLGIMSIGIIKEIIDKFINQWRQHG
tara:strand:+ start:252 stop:410 length:159 start_codon:yes stop_codon:yes gene_type:complete